MRKQPGYTIFTTAIIGALALMSGSIAMAAPLTVPNNFLSGQAATAGSVNSNFNAVEAAVNDNDARVTINASGVATNASGVATNASGVATNATGINGNTTDIGTNTTNIGNNFSSITGNTTDIGTNTSAIAGHETRIGALEAGGGGGTATPVTIDCATAGAGAIQTAIDTAEPLGRLTITIDGTCLENVVITRDNVTLLGGTLGVISGTTGTPTISASQKAGLEITGLTIGGGQSTVVVENGSNLQVTNSTIGGGAGSGITALGSIVRIFGSTTINGGGTPGESPGIDAVGNALVQFVSGNITVNAGIMSSALACELASSVVAGDLQSLPNVTVNGSGPGTAVDFVENCYLGMFSGSINGDMAFSMNSTLTLEAFAADGTSVAVTGNTIIDSSSAALLAGNTVAVTGDITVQRSSSLSLREGATISGTLQVRASSGMDADTAGTIGTLECDTFTGNYIDIFPQSLNVASNYLVDGATPIVIPPATEFFACGFIFP